MSGEEVRAAKSEKDWEREFVYGGIRVRVGEIESERGGGESGKE